jgi:O-acetyl-ADP-ribose deacetylase (regulator of RNase III)
MEDRFTPNYSLARVGHVVAVYLTLLYCINLCMLARACLLLSTCCRRANTIPADRPPRPPHTLTYSAVLSAHHRSMMCAANNTENNNTNWTVLKTYPRANTNLPDVVLVQGSVLDFHCQTGTVGCIVNAANEGCLGGGGVDGAITDAGGPALAADRLRLPILCLPTNKNDQTSDDDEEGYERRRDVRCPTGSAVMTGPGDYGDLRVPYVIHAVGPNYSKWRGQRRIEEGHALLKTAYTASLDLAAKTKDVEEIAFCLLSAGVFRGRVDLRLVLWLGLQAIAEWRPPAPTAATNGHISKIYLFAFTETECRTLLEVGRQVFGSNKVDESE